MEEPNKWQNKSEEDGYICVKSSITPYGELEDLYIKVPCGFRWKFYKAQLEEAYSAISSGCLSMKSTKIVFLPKLILHELLTHLASILDEQIIDCLDHEFKNDAENKNIIDKATKREKYIEYCRNTSVEFLQERFQNLFETNKIVTHNFIQTRLMALKRIQQDFDVLKSCFLKELGNNIKLYEISSSGSDFHKQGQQVLILTFIDSTNKSKKVIYKPSPVQADALLVGNIEELKTINKNYQGHFSLIELLNSALSEESKLPTYLIVPMNDAEEIEALSMDEIPSIHLNAHYGYIKYLQHTPWEEPKSEEIIEKGLKLEISSQNVQKGLQTEVDNTFNEFLKKAAEDEKCDFIARNKADVYQYSHDCGLLFSLLLIGGIIDSHCENLLLCFRRPLLIDVEICLNFRLKEIMDALALDINLGSMSGISLMSKDYTFLFHIGGRIPIKIKYAEKNKFFQHLYLKKDDKIVPCSPELETFMKGFKLGLKLFSQNQEKLKNWFELPCVKNMLIRVPLYTSPNFKDDINNLKKYDFSPVAYKKIQSTAIELGIMDNQPFCAIYLNNDPLTNIYSEYKSLNIPVFYAVASQNHIYNAYG